MEQESTKENPMTTNDESPRHEAALFTSIRGWGITRGEHGVFGGVVEGVGERIGLARAPARIIAVVLLFLMQGFFFALYAAAWALLPDRSGRIIIQDFGRGTPNVGALIVIAIFGVIGLSENPAPWSFNRHWGSFPFGGLWALIPLAVAIGVGALAFFLASRANKPPSASGPMAIPPRRASAAAAPGSATFAATPAGTPAGTPATTTPTKAARAAAASSAQGPSTATPADGVAADDAHAAAPHATPSTPPPPPRPRTPGPGSAIYLLTLSTAVFAAAAIWLLDREGQLAVSPVVAWLAVAVVIIGGAIILTGAAGRRIGFLGFLATTFIIGWIIGLTVIPRALDFADGGATITIDGITHTIGNGHGWFDQNADGVGCGSYSLSASEISGATRYVVEPGQTSVIVTSETAVVVVPEDASVVFRSEAIVNGSVSVESRDVTCTLTRAQGDLYSILRTGDTVVVDIAAPRATIAIEEN